MLVSVVSMLIFSHFCGEAKGRMILFEGIVPNSINIQTNLAL